MNSTILIKHAQVVFPDGVRPANILVEGGKISKISDGLSAPAETVLDGKGLHLFPGVIDPHVHFREPGVEHKEDLESGSRAAAAGGVTSFFEMPNTVPATITRAALAEKKGLASEKSLINYNFFIGATPDNLEELNGAENVPGIKIFMGSSTGDLLVDKLADLEKIFGNGSKLIAVHAEDEEMVQENWKKFRDSLNPADYPKIRTPEAALKATQLAVSLSQRFHRRLHILHLTSADEVSFLAKEKKRMGW